MTYRFEIIKKRLHFKFAAGTSRGIYHTRNCNFVVLRDNDGRAGIGECSPLPKLSCDDVQDYDKLLKLACCRLNAAGNVDDAWFDDYPSVRFGLETALLHLRGQSLAFYDTPFSRGEAGITVNGLIWMGDYQLMLSRIKRKLDAGFSCIKLKIGAIDFDDELELIKKIRLEFDKDLLCIRVDANGAFSQDNALRYLEALSEYDVHSIEQPLAKGKAEQTSRLCAISPVDIALDEELIGVNDNRSRQELLDLIKPKYLVLKPALHGGIKGCLSWIDLAKKRGIGYWITSALESNVGLNAIAQFTATLNPAVPQGLGTGQLFYDNFSSPLSVLGERLYFDPFMAEQDFIAELYAN